MPVIVIWTLVAVLAVVIVATKFKIERKRILSEASVHLDSQAKTSEEALKAAIGAIEITLSRIASDLRDRNDWSFDPARQTVESAARDLQKIVPLAHIRIVDDKGEIQLATDGLPPVANFRDRDWFVQPRDNADRDTFVGEIVSGRILKGHFALFSRRLSDKKGKFRGVVAVSLDTKYFQRYGEDLKLSSKDTFSVVIGKTPRYAFRSVDHASFVGKEFKYHPVAKSVFEGFQRHVILDQVAKSDGAHRLMVVRRVGDWPIIVAIGKSRQQILAAWTTESVMGMTITLIAIALSLGTLFFYLKYQERMEFQRTQLAHSAKLVALGEMCGAIAHEINNPLAIIKGRVELLQEKLIEKGEVSREAQLRDLEKVASTVNRISKIVSGLRSFSRNSDQDPMAAVSLRTVIDDTMELCRQKFKSANVEIRIADFKECSVQGRAAELSQVFLNLLSNALDAVSELPEKWVEIQVNFYQESGRDWAIVNVTDSGSGIPIEVVQRMMDPFFSTKPVGKGTGLGLSISHNLIRAHGGSLDYDSQNNHTRFAVKLPIEFVSEVKRAA